MKVINFSLKQQIFFISTNNEKLYYKLVTLANVVANGAIVEMVMLGAALDVRVDREQFHIYNIFLSKSCFNFYLNLNLKMLCHNAG